jgi:hypothetical protein
MKTIQFTPIKKSILGLINPPISASKMLPEWYKHQNAIIGDKLELNDGGAANISVKKCMPVLDDMSAGYYITLPSDVIVSFNDNAEPNFSWSLDIVGKHNPDGSLDALPPLVATHSREQIANLQIPFEYSTYPFKWNTYYRITTPPGYSCMFRQPSWRFDVPFYTLSGLVDTDKHPVPVNLPFLIRDRWEGIIPEGTPIAQVIPFKRTDWVSEVVGTNNKEGSREFRKSTKKIMHRYKDNWRSIKTWK